MAHPVVMVAVMEEAVQIFCRLMVVAVGLLAVEAEEEGDIPANQAMAVTARQGLLEFFHGR